VLSRVYSFDRHAGGQSLNIFQTLWYSICHERQVVNTHTLYDTEFAGLRLVRHAGALVKLKYEITHSHRVLR